MSIRLVKEFAEKFNLPMEEKPSILEKAEFDFRHGRLNEELHEFYDSQLLNDLAGCFDALLDLAYVTYGTALRMGITPEQWERGFEAVHKANMAKIKVTDIDCSRFKNINDIVKPLGWQGPEPELKKIIGI